MTRVVTKGELGRPVGRLREQMEKMQLHSSHRSEGKADMLEQQLVMAGERVRRLEGEKQVAETRAEIAERRVSTSLVPRPLEKLKKNGLVSTVGFTKFTQLHMVTSQFVMVWVSALRARIEDRTGSRHDFVEVNSLL